MSLIYYFFMNKPIIAIIILIVSIGFFYAGMTYAQKKLSSPRGANRSGQFFMTGNEQFQRGAPGGRANGSITAGEIIAKDNTSVTIRLRDGGSRIIFFSDTTPVLKSVEGTASDLSVGQQITVTGSANTDGSTTAESLQIRPANTTTTNR